MPYSRAASRTGCCSAEIARYGTKVHGICDSATKRSASRSHGCGCGAWWHDVLVNNASGVSKGDDESPGRGYQRRLLGPCAQRSPRAVHDDRAAARSSTSVHSRITGAARLPPTRPPTRQSSNFDRRGGALDQAAVHRAPDWTTRSQRAGSRIPRAGIFAGRPAGAWKGERLRTTYGEAVAAAALSRRLAGLPAIHADGLQGASRRCARGTACRNGDGSWTPLT